MFAKKVPDDSRKAIVSMWEAGKCVMEISEKLKIDGRVVSGIVAASRAAARGTGKIRAAGPILPSLPFPAKEDQMKALAKSWKEAEPDTEFSMHTQKGQKVYIACYKGGIVLRVGEQKKVALLTSDMASRLGGKLIEMAQWSMRIR